MVTTRSMSKTTTKSDTEVAKRESKKATSGWRYSRIEDDAFDIFALKDYNRRYFETHPRPKGGLMPEEAIRGANLEWLNMSDSDKKEWIQYAKKRKAE